MAAIQDTVYPRLSYSLEETMLQKHFQLTAEEILFLKQNSYDLPSRIGLALLLKTFQHLGYFTQLHQLPSRLVKYVYQQLETEGKVSKTTLHQYDTSASKKRHLQLLRDFLTIKPITKITLGIIRATAKRSATTKDNIADIINEIIEELVAQRFELPVFATLLRIARSARHRVNQSYYQQVYDQIPLDYRKVIEDLLTKPVEGEKSSWHLLKMEPKKPSASHIRLFTNHLEWMQQIHQPLKVLEQIPNSKKERFIQEAYALDVSAMRRMNKAKQHCLVVSYIDHQAKKVLDDVADLFIKMVEQIRTKSIEKLNSYYLEATEKVNELVFRLQNVLSAYHQPKKWQAIQKELADDSHELLGKCQNHIAATSNNHFLYLLPFFQKKRSVLFNAIELLELASTTNDTTILTCLDFIKKHRNRRKEWLEITEDELPLDWIPEKARKLVTGYVTKTPTVERIHKKYFEICVFSEIVHGLKSLDLCVKGSLEREDYRKNLLSLEAYERQLPDFEKVVEYPVEAEAFVEYIGNMLQKKIRDTDVSFPENEFASIENGELLVQKLKKNKSPESYERLDEALKQRMQPVSILDIVAHTEKWLALSRQFGPLSGYESRIDEYSKQLVSTLFCYGCNLGPTQTSRSLKHISRKQLAWMNQYHITEDRINDCITQLVNTYATFALPKYWGDGSSASADGTHWNIFEQNLLSEYHIRYGSYGGIGYYHVSDTYIALFSNFIPCGVYEAIYVLDGILNNRSDIQPDTVHGDTHAQNEAVFGLAYLLGIKKMPRIRKFKHLIFYKKDNNTQFDHIDEIFSDTINWKLIKTHLSDMLRVAISIKTGKITASSFLKKLSRNSRKNKLYFAFRELGRVVRTDFLLDFISDPELRKMIQGATNKSEEYNAMIKWSAFGNNGIIAENIRYEQNKIIKYNQLVTNSVILHNVNEMTRVIKELKQEGFKIDAKLLRALSPYRTEHINRFGQYQVDMDTPIDHLKNDIKPEDLISA